MPEQVPHRKIEDALPIIVLALLTTVCILPVLLELSSSLWGLASQESLANDPNQRSASPIELIIPKWGLLFRSIVSAGIVACLATAMGWPLAHMLGNLGSIRSRIIAALLIIPAWLPASLIYASGNLLRAPDTLIGRSLIEYATASDSRRWMTIWAGYAIAIVSLAIWLTPIAAMLLASMFGKRTTMFQDMMAIEPVRLHTRIWMWLRIHQRAILRCWVLCLIMMLGSAVPMHLAGLETYSIVIWRTLAETMPDQWGKVWVTSWPMLLAALTGAYLLTKQLTQRKIPDQYSESGMRASRVSVPLYGLAFGMCTLGSAVPLLSMLITLDDLGSVLYFWKLQREAVSDSAIVAIICFGFGTTVAATTWYTLSHPSAWIRRVGSLTLAIWMLLGLLPGVLLGAAVARSELFYLQDDWVRALLAAWSRSALWGAIIGALSARSEHDERRSIRWQLAGASLRAWLRSQFPAMLLPLLAAGLICGLYGFYEIEASVIVRDPGIANLPQQLLSDMHYARIEQLSAAGVNLMFIGTFFAIIASCLLVWNHSESE